MQTIFLNQNDREMTLMVTRQSILRCVNASSRDVFTRGIIAGSQRDLYPGDTMLIAPSTLTARIFSRNTAAGSFSAVLELDDF